MSVGGQEEAVISANCSDENGNIIAQDTQSECEFETEM
jgi:hypothetical protein